MAHLGKQDIEELFEMFEAELRLLWEMDRLEKMRLRRRIINVLWPIVNASSLDVDIVVGTIKDRLGDVIRLFRDRRRFMENLYDFLSERLDRDILTPNERRRKQLRALGR